ncbi:MAG: hypothetical protein OXD30_00475, partial [Bryobacterales bacterium]|nr:hypothetical protein [Bryobacterales bacterium]
MIFDHRGEAGGSLEAYLGSIAARLRAVAAARGAGALGLTALGGTAACVFFANQAAFSRASVIGSRAILLAALGAAGLVDVGFGTSRVWAGWVMPREEQLYELRY